MPADDTVSMRIAAHATAMGWDHDALLPHFDFTIPEAMHEVTPKIPEKVGQCGSDALGRSS